MPKTRLKTAINVKRLWIALAIVLVLGVLLAGSYAYLYSLWLTSSTAAIDLSRAGKFNAATSKAKESLRISRTMHDRKSFALSLRIMASIYACRREFDTADFWN